MLRALLTAAVFLTTFSAWAAPDLDALVGRYSFSRKTTFSGMIVRDRPDAAVVKDEIYVEPLQTRFERFIFYAQAQQPGYAPPPATFTIYRAPDGRLYSLVWDQGSLTNEEDWRRPSFVENLARPGEGWIELKAKSDRKLMGVFYPRDFMSRLSVTIELGERKARIKTWEKEIFFMLIPVPARTLDTFKRVD